MNNNSQEETFCSVGIEKVIINGNKRRPRQKYSKELCPIKVSKTTVIYVFIAGSRIKFLILSKTKESSRVAASKVTISTCHLTCIGVKAKKNKIQ